MAASPLFGAVAPPDPAYHLAAPVVVLTANEKFYYSQTRAAVVPGNPTRFLLTTQETDLHGTHSYRDMMMVESSDGVRWSDPQRIPTLARRHDPDGFDRVMGDMTPQWHDASKAVLATGKMFNFRDGKLEDRSRESVSYAVFTPATSQWSELSILELPARDHGGALIVAPNSGCVQRFDRPDGDVLLPIRYHKNRANAPYVTLVARCGFDGEKLVYREHGTELSGPKNAQLYEPSLTSVGGEYFLTMRSDLTAYVTKGTDGIHYAPVIEWTFDDGVPVGIDNTQQHWITHGDYLLLVYTRRGAGNDHVFRHRAPLFLAEVDRARLCLIRSTEQVVFQENHADLGNFGVSNVSPTETWVVTSEMTLTTQHKGRRRILIVKVDWSKPNLLFPNN